MSEFLFWHPHKAGAKDRCNYCGKFPEFISQHPGFHFGYLGCYSCVSDGTLTPHYHSIDTFDLGRLTHHVNHSKLDIRNQPITVKCHEIGNALGCVWCLEDQYPQIRANRIAAEKEQEALSSTRPKRGRPFGSKKRKRVDASEFEDDDYDFQPEPEKKRIKTEKLQKPETLKVERKPIIIEFPGCMKPTSFDEIVVDCADC